ncbi:MAG: 16S rRNA (cytosine(1402)-N(4))-methyltransferase RsmH, partial [Chitinophagaceae bacterium]|nr:16S rRNA (cytosine(1402)-N(4))-methyltransferase RsmH [Chitinophagaceae bacterium]
MTKSSLHNKQSNNSLLEEGGEAGYHVPVLMHEALDALQINAEGVYVDCTFGGGGHSKAILEKLGKNGKLIAFDQDEDAGKNLPKDERIIFVPNNFRHLQRFLRLHKHPKVDGILADLGVSSHQFNEAARGFSIRFNGPLDMRMNVNQEMTAADILLRYSEQQLHQLFGSYGEVTNAKTLAKHIVQYRQKAALNSIEAFKQLIAPVVKGNPN